MAQLVASMSGVVLGGVVEVVGSNLARGKIFTASIGSVDSLYPSVYIYIYIYINGYKSKNSAKFSTVFDIYSFIFISQINLASFTGSSATGKISRLVH